jgi:hypothetical protein
MSDVHMSWLVLARDPYLIFGLLLCGVPSIVWWYVYRKLGEIGLKAFWSGACITENAGTRAKHGWPAWPLHVMWLSLIIGVPLLFVGAVRL